MGDNEDMSWIAGDINTHRDNMQKYVDKGWVWVRDNLKDRVDMADPETTCLHPMEQKLPCLLDKGHRGRHSCVTFYCDGCGKKRRGNPHQSALDPDGVPDADFCFMCVRNLT
jgi:hypothetical protein